MLSEILAGRSTLDIVLSTDRDSAFLRQYLQKRQPGCFLMSRCHSIFGFLFDAATVCRGVFFTFCVLVSLPPCDGPFLVLYNPCAMDVPGRSV